MSTLADFRTKVRALLDVEAARYRDSLLDACLRRALGRYSRAYPDTRQSDITLESGGWEQPLTGLSGIQSVLEVRCPVIPGTEPPPLRYHFYFRSGIPMLIVGAASMPAAGDVLRVLYAADQTISGLDGATTTSLRGSHVEELAAGAAAYAVLARAASLVETYGSKLAEPVPLFDWAVSGEKQFDAWLRTLMVEKTGAVEYLPTLCWYMDEWDRA